MNMNVMFLEGIIYIKELCVYMRYTPSRHSLVAVMQIHIQMQLMTFLKHRVAKIGLDE